MLNIFLYCSSRRRSFSVELKGKIWTLLLLEGASLQKWSWPMLESVGGCHFLHLEVDGSNSQGKLDLKRWKYVHVSAKPQAWSPSMINEIHAHVAEVALTSRIPPREVSYKKVMCELCAWFPSWMQFMTLEKSCYTSERWQCGWFAMFSLEAQSFECVKVLKKAAADLSAAHACESCVFKNQSRQTRWEVSILPVAMVVRVRLSNERGVKFQMPKDRQDYIPPISATTASIHFQIMAKNETWKSFFLVSPCSVLISHGLARLLSITIAHLFSFVSPLVSPFNPFSFPPPSVPFTAAFISTRSLNLWQLLFSITSLSLFTSVPTSFFSLPPPVCHPFPASFNLHKPYFSFDCSLPRPFLSAFLSTHSLPLCQMCRRCLQSQQSPPWAN